MLVLKHLLEDTVSSCRRANARIGLIPAHCQLLQRLQKLPAVDPDRAEYQDKVDVPDTEAVRRVVSQLLLAFLACLACLSDSFRFFVDAACGAVAVVSRGERRAAGGFHHPFRPQTVRCLPALLSRLCPNLAASQQTHLLALQIQVRLESDPGGGEALPAAQRQARAALAHPPAGLRPRTRQLLVWLRMPKPPLVIPVVVCLGLAVDLASRVLSDGSRVVLACVQFEVPLPPLQPAVFMPTMRELPPPSLDLFDLDQVTALGCWLSILCQARFSFLHFSVIALVLWLLGCMSLSLTPSPCGCAAACVCPLLCANLPGCVGLCLGEAASGAADQQM